MQPPHFKSNRPTIGIVGGMGPSASNKLAELLIKLNDVETDNDHIHFVLDNNPNIPDRTQYLQFEGPSPVPAILESIDSLRRASADNVVFPCNTTYAWPILSELSTHSPLPIIDMPKIVVDYITAYYAPGSRIAILGTTGTIAFGVYANPLKELGFDVYQPNNIEQKKLMDAIYDIKAQKNYVEAQSKIETITNRLQETKPLDAVIYGCTELSLLGAKDERIIDPLTLLTEHILALKHGLIPTVHVEQYVGTK